MGLKDKLRKLTEKAEQTAVDHQDQLHEAVKKAESTADQRSGGQYHDQLAKAAAKADDAIDRLNPTPPDTGGATPTK